MTYTITPRPPHRDVLLERDGEPLVIVRYREGAPDPAGEALAEARRIARAEAVIEAARDLDAYERRIDRVPWGGAVRRIRLAAAIRDLDGES